MGRSFRDFDSSERSLGEHVGCGDRRNSPEHTFDLPSHILDKRGLGNEAISCCPDNFASTEEYVHWVSSANHQGITIERSNRSSQYGLLWEKNPRLVQRTTDAVGTVKITHRGIPTVLKKGEVVSAKCGKLVALKWRDKRDVSMLTTRHSIEMQPITALYQHFIQENPQTGTFKVGRRKCVVCTKSGTRKETRYRCKNYLGTPSLCLDPCFERYHTQVNY
ncbi:hypothetical protein J437_LFUL012394 [Ladona fulva]|uniref:PiggyBac transposable element-derived protein 4 C-terminal zinc-finger domain-containing protein n=1 Tax=Ladona fulva TaxID=123851 RepID=A0A8K0KPN8_LADFU|nr:hypothetical protein J437_LFUL012394 [Ladona fulva]